MARQLTLLEVPPAWRLDDATREVGRKGIAAARASLRAATSNTASSTAASHRRAAA
ncbi:MAG: hypothetical protein WD691_10560 [Acidimicrobiales bacterium]